MGFTVARQLIVMALIVVTSFLFSKKGNFSEGVSGYLSKLLLYVINPCMIISTFNVDYDFEKMRELFFAIILSFAVHFVMTIVAVLAFHGKTNFSIGLDKLAVIFTNSGFIGIPLIKGVFGLDGVFYLMGYIFVFNVFLWTYGEYQMTQKINLKKIFTNPNVIACIVGVVEFMLPAKLPYVISEPIQMIGLCNGAVSMILLGVLFAGFKKSGESSSYAKEVAFVTIVRLVICPVVIAVFLSQLFKAMNAGGFFPEHLYMIFNVIYIASLCPVGMSVSGFAVVFKKDPSYSSLLVSISSAACIVTTPAFVVLFGLLAK